MLYISFYFCLCYKRLEKTTSGEESLFRLVIPVYNQLVCSESEAVLHYAVHMLELNHSLGGKQIEGDTGRGLSNPYLSNTAMVFTSNHTRLASTKRQGHRLGFYSNIGGYCIFLPLVGIQPHNPSWLASFKRIGTKETKAKRKRLVPEIPGVLKMQGNLYVNKVWSDGYSKAKWFAEESHRCWG